MDLLVSLWLLTLAMNLLPKNVTLAMPMISLDLAAMMNSVPTALKFLAKLWMYHVENLVRHLAAVSTQVLHLLNPQLSVCLPPLRQLPLPAHHLHPPLRILLAQLQQHQRLRVLHLPLLAHHQRLRVLHLVQTLFSLYLVKVEQVTTIFQSRSPSKTSHT